MRRVVILLGLFLGGSVLAQESDSFELAEHSFNAGGSPQDGALLMSPNFRLSLSAIGQGVTPGALTSTNFGLSGGFVSTYPPPGEVTNQRFADPTTLFWDGERSVGVYNLYQGVIANPFDPAYGACTLPDIATASTSFGATPGVGEAFFVLLTAENRLREEGTKGTNSSGILRPNLTPCP